MISVDDKSHPWRESMTVLDLLKDLDDQYPYVVIRLNNKYISKPNFDKTLIPDNAIVHLMPMIAGG
jgi:thiamine biosynthesis protein ThiS